MFSSGVSLMDILCVQIIYSELKEDHLSVNLQILNLKNYGNF